jgi:haloalkane dehalogenase
MCSDASSPGSWTPEAGVVAHVDNTEGMTTQRPQPPFVRTPESNFVALRDFPFEPHLFELDGLKMHYVDEGPRNAPVALLVHGMPTWSYLYRHMIPPLVAAGFRCIAPDHIGFGRSDKVTDPAWYDIARHTANLTRLVTALDLRNITAFVQDWGGPTGLAQYAQMPDRFARLVIMNTWLDHEGYEYSPGILRWISLNQPGGLFRDNIPGTFNWGTLMAIGTRRADAASVLTASRTGTLSTLPTDVVDVIRAYDAPFVGMGDDGVAGPRRFPLSIPVHDPVAGDAAVQRRAFDAVNTTSLPVHFVWGVHDDVFTREWGLAWHGMIPHSTWHELDTGHFPQDTHGADIVAHVISQIG